MAFSESGAVRLNLAELADFNLMCARFFSAVARGRRDRRDPRAQP
jgi:hypothetical protein